MNVSVNVTSERVKDGDQRVLQASSVVNVSVDVTSERVKAGDQRVLQATRSVNVLVDVTSERVKAGNQRAELQASRAVNVCCLLQEAATQAHRRRAGHVPGPQTALHHQGMGGRHLTACLAADRH